MDLDLDDMDFPDDETVSVSPGADEPLSEFFKAIDTDRRVLNRFSPKVGDGIEALISARDSTWEALMEVLAEGEPGDLSTLMQYVQTQLISTLETPGIDTRDEEGIVFRDQTVHPTRAFFTACIEKKNLPLLRHATAYWRLTPLPVLVPILRSILASRLDPERAPFDHDTAARVLGMYLDLVQRYVTVSIFSWSFAFHGLHQYIDKYVPADMDEPDFSRAMLLRVFWEYMFHPLTVTEFSPHTDTFIRPIVRDRLETLARTNSRMRFTDDQHNRDVAAQGLDYASNRGRVPVDVFRNEISKFLISSRPWHHAPGRARKYGLPFPEAPTRDQVMTYLHTCGLSTQLSAALEAGLLRPSRAELEALAQSAVQRRDMDSLRVLNKHL